MVDISVWIVLGLYALMMVGIAVYTSNKSRNLNDFFLAGRNMGGWMTAFAYGTTYFSAVMFIGFAGKVGWGFGVSAVWIGIGNALVGSLLAWLLLAKRTRRITHALDASTMPEFFEKRYGSRAMKIIAALMVFIFLVPYSASVYKGLSYLTEAVIGIPFIWCMLGMAVLTGVYLVLGGYKATALTDFVQGIIMLGGVIVVIILVVGNPKVGDLAAGMQKLADIDPKLTQFFSPPNFLSLLSLVLLTSLGTWGLPHIVHKFYAVRDNKAIMRGTIISTLFALIISGGGFFLGSLGRLYLDKIPVDAVTGAANPDMIMPQVYSQALPPVMMGIVLVLILAASMSTLSSMVLISSSAISMDLVGGAIAPKMKKSTVTVWMRVFCGVFVLLSFGLAMMPANNVLATSIISLMSVSWGALAGSFIGPFITGLWMKRAGKASAWAGMLAGLGTALFLNFIWPLFNIKIQGLTVDATMAGIIAMLVGIIVSVLVAVFAPAKQAFDTDAKAPESLPA